MERPITPVGAPAPPEPVPGFLLDTICDGPLGGPKCGRRIRIHDGYRRVTCPCGYVYEVETPGSAR